MENRFKLVCVAMGTGWPSGHVAIDRYITWPERAGGKEMCLNSDTENAEELIAEIDDLIEELRQLRAQVPQRFEQWKRMFETGR